MTAAPQTAPRLTAGASAQTRVLVVDDDALIGIILKELLQTMGYSVAVACDAEAGLAEFAAQPFDVVLLDVRMPGSDGVEACPRFRGLPGGDRAAIVLMSAGREPELRQRAVHSGADDFLPKPLDTTEVTLRVRSLVRLKRLRDDLDARGAQLREQSSALLRAQEERRQLNAMIVHDLKGPLSVLLSNVRYALDEKAALSTDAREGLEEVVESATAMHRMVLDLLDTDRAEEGKLTPRSTVSPAREVLNAAFRSAVGKGRATSHRFVVSPASEALMVNADQDLLRRVLENLIDNAFKYAPRGSLIELGAAPRGQGVALWVSDEGPGIPEAARTSVFDRYVRLDRDTQTSEHSSRGLGLAFCRVAVEAMGGTIHVEDQQPRGSRFVVRLRDGVPDA